MKTSSSQPAQRTDQPSRSETSFREQRDQQSPQPDRAPAQSQQIREEVSHEEIARRAHELWEQDGRQDGRDQEHWLEAEKQLRGSSFRTVAESESGDAHAQARAIKASAERRSNAQTRN